MKVIDKINNYLNEGIDKSALKKAIEVEIGLPIKDEVKITGSMVSFETIKNSPWFCKVTATGKLKKNSCRTANY